MRCCGSPASSQRGSDAGDMGSGVADGQPSPVAHRPVPLSPPAPIRLSGPVDWAGGWPSLTPRFE